MKSILFTTLFILFGCLTLTAHVELLNPVGGESYSPGEVVTIDWKVIIPHDTRGWDLSFSNDGGVNWEDVNLHMSVSTLSYQWTVPQITTSQARIRIIQDNNGTNYGDVSGNFNISGTTAINDIPLKDKITVAPNPFSDFTLFEMENPGHKNHSLAIYNFQGQLVREINAIVNERIRIKRENFESGMYFYLLYQGNEIKAKGKLIVN